MIEDTMTNTETAVSEYREINFAVESLVRSPRGANHIFRQTHLREPYRDGNLHRIDSLIRKFKRTQEAMRPNSNQAQLDYAARMEAAVQKHRGMMNLFLATCDMMKSEFDAVEWITYRKIIALIVEWRTEHDRHVTIHD